MQGLTDELQRRRAAHLYRSRRVLEGSQRPRLRIDGVSLLSFCSNDYLGLAADHRLIEALAHGARKYGVGAGAAHLISGHSRAHHELEEALADFTGRERALLFSTGYMANLGVLQALTGRGDTVFEDRLDHASLIDGGLLSRAALKRYPHADVAALERRLAGASGRRLVATDGVFSMDGDLAPLSGLAAACTRHGAWLLVDDAHGLGVVGPRGRGTVALHGLDSGRVPILMGTLGKAFGTSGAFVAGSEALIETLIQQARSYVYTTAAPPAVAVATLRALQIAEAEEWRRERLVELVGRFRREAEALGFELLSPGSTAQATPIQPILAGSAERALAWSRALEERGILVTAIRPPTVPEHGARLRVTFSAAHSEADLDRLLEALRSLPPDGDSG
jgi:8-amino-7-oxononanoate synthase